VNPIPLSTRETVESLTLTPQTFPRNSRLSESVALGRARRSASKSRLASWPVLGLEPGLFFGASGRPSSAILAYRLTEERETPKERAAWLLAHTATEGLYYLCAQVFRISVHALMMPLGHLLCKPL